MTPEDVLARQAHFWQMWRRRTRAELAERAPLLVAFRPGRPPYAMDRYFCRLVDEARRTIPGEAVLRPETLLTPEGWVVLDEPAPLPGGGPPLRAVGWYRVPPPPGTAGPGGIQVVSLTEDAAWGLGALHMTWGVADAQTTLSQLVAQMNQGQNAQRMGVHIAADPLHVVRWFYTAVNLMANKLTLVVPAPFARAERRRAASAEVALPDVFRRVTLRRVEAARQQAGAAGQARDWQWQWTVRGHWRHCQDGHVVFIDAYIKGPADKPLKPTQTPFFQVQR